MPGHDAAGFLRATLLDQPWADDELPSLVATDDRGEIIGFIGSQVRRIRLDDRVLRAVSPAHLAVADDRRAGAAGALLLRRLLAAGQDLTYTDQATDIVMRMWRTFGGGVDSARVCDWMLLLRPLRWLGRVTLSAIREGSLRRERIPVGALPFQAAARVFRRAPEPLKGVVGEDATAAAIVEALPDLTKGVRLRVDYDEPYLRHLFEQMDAYFPDPVVRRLVRRDGRPIGWYAYRLGRQRSWGTEGTARVLNLTTTESEGDAVLQELMEHARAQGSAVLAGRLEPRLMWPLRRQLAVMGFARQPAIHANDPVVLATLASSESLLTQLDSEWFVTR
jgi:hypothetical protein